MKIFLNQAEIEEAVREHIEKSVALKEGSEMSLDFLAGRGENGISVTVDIKYMGVETLDLSAGDKTTAKPPKAEKAAPTTVAKTTLPKTKGATTVGGGLAGAAQSVVGNSKPLDLSAPDTAGAAAEQAAEAGAEATTGATEPSTDVVDAGDGSQEAEAGNSEAAEAQPEAAAATDGGKPVKSLFS